MTRKRRDALTLKHLGLVSQVAHKLSTRVPMHVEIDDLTSAGYVGLLEAATSFDNARGVPFGAFARRRILGAMLDHLRRGDMLGRVDRRAVRNGERSFFVVQLDTLDNELNRDNGVGDLQSVEPTPDEVLQRSHVSRQVAGAIARLPTRERHVVEQYYFRGRVLSEIATDLRVGDARVSQLKAQAIIRLRRWLAA